MVGSSVLRFETPSCGCRLRFLDGTGIDAGTLGGAVGLVNGVPTPNYLLPGLSDSFSSNSPTSCLDLAPSFRIAEVM